MTSIGSQSQTASTSAAASPTDRGQPRKGMTMQSPHYLRADQCAQQTLIRLVGSYAPRVEGVGNTKSVRPINEQV